ncbi:MAG: hypothetical protein NT171_08490 [Planctomycetota bacterium]|nr:hypothetical protein [Planctomycetota bacterium]
MPTETLPLRVVRHRPTPPLVIGVPHSNPAFRTGYPPPTDLDSAGRSLLEGVSVTPLERCKPAGGKAVTTTNSTGE